MGQWRNQIKNQKIPWDKWTWKHDTPKSMGCSKSSSKREFYSNRELPKETRKISNNLTYHLNELEKEQSPKSAEKRK